ncbi:MULTISPECIES: CBS domain-containing protein [unclassified Streptomyces]|uniref:CBS domain-containing protein n=1 Tax=unclassified Streptomyces TaxID=2593676 RepID=UPI002E7834FB|nr:CBS domain-containing protein [Streptomyces sp. JV176]MEE1803512.1 CBS domain-containing protein [Streptomyces sp. JV176]
MRFRRAGDVMTADAIRAEAATPIADVARWIAEHGIGGLPVVDDDDKVIGVVARSDLAPYQDGTGRFARPDEAPLPARPDAAGLTAGELMSAPAVTVHAVDSLALTGRTMADRRVGRLPVVDEEARLVGILTRRDLLRVFVRPDSDLRDEILDEVVVRALWLDPALLTVSVVDGVVTLRGRPGCDVDASVATGMVARVDGVVAVVNELTGRCAHASR